MNKHTGHGFMVRDSVQVWDYYGRWKLELYRFSTQDNWALWVWFDEEPDYLNEPAWGDEAERIYDDVLAADVSDEDMVAYLDTAARFLLSGQGVSHPHEMDYI